MERVGTRVSAAAQSQCPQSVNCDWLAVAILESSKEVSVGIKRVYLSVAEITNKNISAELAKGE